MQKSVRNHVHGKGSDARGNWLELRIYRPPCSHDSSRDHSDSPVFVVRHRSGPVTHGSIAVHECRKHFADKLSSACPDCKDVFIRKNYINPQFR